MTLLHFRMGSFSAFAPLAAKIGSGVGRWAGAGSRLKRWVAAEGDPSELLRLSDHLLADMGMARADLDVAALFWRPAPSAFSGGRAARQNGHSASTVDQALTVTSRGHATTMRSAMSRLETAGLQTDRAGWRMAAIGTMLAAAAIATVVHPALADSAPPMTGMPRLAIGGYDTVAYFTDNKAVPGSLDYQTVWHDARWQFASKEHLDLFNASPEKYAAQYDGHCAMGVAYEKGHKDTVDPEAFTIVDGKLYVNHTKYWTTEWRKNERENISKADENWLTVKTEPEPTK